MCHIPLPLSSGENGTQRKNNPPKKILSLDKHERLGIKPLMESNNKDLSFKQINSFLFPCIRTQHNRLLYFDILQVHGGRRSVNLAQQGQNVQIATVTLGCEHCSFKCLSAQVNFWKRSFSIFRVSPYVRTRHLAFDR